MPQKTYEVTAPNGRVFEVTGDRPPSEMELRSIFAGMEAKQSRPTPDQPQGSALGRFVGGAAEMLNPVTMVKGAYQMVRHPLDTYEAMVGQSAEQFGKAREAWDRGGVSEAIGHTGAAVLPMIGPMAADIGEQAGQGDIAGALGATTGLLAGPKALKEAVKIPVRVPAVRAALERGAVSRVQDVMTPKASSQVARRMAEKAKEIAPQILKENKSGFGWSRDALQKQILGKLDSAEQNLDAATDARLEARALETQPVLDALREKRAAQTVQAVDASQPTRTTTTRTSAIVDESGRPIEVTESRAVPYGQDVVPGPNQPRVSQIDQAIGEIEQLGPTSRYEPLKRMRQAYDKPARTVYNPSLVDDFLKKSGEAKGAADVTAALRETLAKADPATAEANASYALYRSASDVLEVAQQIEQVRPKVGRQIMARLTGTLFGAKAAGPAGAAAGYALAPAVDSLVNAGFTTKLKTAQLMQTLADAMKSGNQMAFNDALRQVIKEAVSVRVPSKATTARVSSVAAGRQTERVGQE